MFFFNTHTGWVIVGHRMHICLCTYIRMYCPLTCTNSSIATVAIEAMACVTSNSVNAFCIDGAIVGISLAFIHICEHNRGTTKMFPYEGVHDATISEKVYGNISTLLIIICILSANMSTTGGQRRSAIWKWSSCMCVLKAVVRLTLGTEKPSHQKIKT